MYNSQNVAERIKNVAKSKKISVKAMLKEIGLGAQALQNMKTSMPKADNLAKIADFLDCSVDYLLGRSDSIGRSQNSFDSSSCKNTASSDKVEISQDSDDISEIAAMYKQLSLVDKAQIVVMMHKMLERKS